MSSISLLEKLTFGFEWDRTYKEIHQELRRLKKLRKEKEQS